MLSIYPPISSLCVNEDAKREEQKAYLDYCDLLEEGMTFVSFPEFFEDWFLSKELKILRENKKEVLN